MAGSPENNSEKLSINFGFPNKKGNRTGSFKDFNTALQKKGIEIPRQLIKKSRLDELIVTEASAFATKTSTLLFGEKAEDLTSKKLPITFVVMQRKSKKDMTNLSILGTRANNEGFFYYQISPKRRRHLIFASAVHGTLKS
jgi:hypothetical protein